MLALRLSGFIEGGVVWFIAHSLTFEFLFASRKSRRLKCSSSSLYRITELLSTRGIKYGKTTQKRAILALLGGTIIRTHDVPKKPYTPRIFTHYIRS